MNTPKTTEPTAPAVASSDLLAETLRDKYTFSRPCCVDETPDAQTVWLKIGNQSFCIDGYQDTKEEADWMRLMLGKALATLVSANDQAQRPRTKGAENATEV